MISEPTMFIPWTLRGSTYTNLLPAIVILEVVNQPEKNKSSHDARLYLLVTL